jgi:hypothetical protein
MSMIKEYMVASNILPQEAERTLSWEKQPTVSIVTDSPNVLSKARRDVLTEDMFGIAFGCAAEAMSNLAK